MGNILYIAGSLRIPTQTVNANYTAAEGDFHIEADASAGAIIITISQLDIDYILVITKSDSSTNVVMIDAGEGNDINGSQTYSLTSQYSTVMLHKVSTTSWRII